MKLNNLIKKNDIFICLEDGVSVIQYLHICPKFNLPVFRHVLVKRAPDLFGDCYHNRCKYLNSCKKQYIEFWFEKHVIKYLKSKKLIKFNRLNAILYLDDKTRRKVYRYLKQNQI